jgi:lysophospholipase L1-like esterase
MTNAVLYLADRHAESFRRERQNVDLVCAVDSLTGWNNYGHFADELHPNAAGAKIVADEVFKALKPLLSETS